MKKNVPDHELLSAYLDGELTAAEQAHVEELLASNPAARQLLDDFRSLSATLQALPQEKLDGDFSDRVLRAAERRVLTGADERPSPAPAPADRPFWKEISWRGMLSRRALMWSAIAGAIALLLMLTEPQHDRGQPKGPEVAQARKETESPAEAQPKGPKPIPTMESLDARDLGEVADREERAKGRKVPAASVGEASKRELLDRKPQASGKRENLARIEPPAPAKLLAGKDVPSEPGRGGVAKAEPYDPHSGLGRQDDSAKKADEPPESHQLAKADASRPTEGLRNATRPEFKKESGGQRATEEAKPASRPAEPPPPEKPRAVDDSAVGKKLQSAPAAPAAPMAEQAPPATTAPPTENKGASLAGNGAPSGAAGVEQKSAETVDRPAMGGQGGMDSGGVSGSGRGRSAPTPDASRTDAATVVHIEITPDAARRQTFDDVLVRNGIVLRGIANEAPATDGPADRDGKSEGERLEGRSQGRMEREKAMDAVQARLIEAPPLDLVLVVAAPEQIEMVLKQLKDHPEQFPSVKEFPASADKAGSLDKAGSAALSMKQKASDHIAHSAGRNADELQEEVGDRGKGAAHRGDQQGEKNEERAIMRKRRAEHDQADADDAYAYRRQAFADRIQIPRNAYGEPRSEVPGADGTQGKLSLGGARAAGTGGGYGAAGPRVGAPALAPGAVRPTMPDAARKPQSTAMPEAKISAALEGNEPKRKVGAKSELKEVAPAQEVAPVKEKASKDAPVGGARGGSPAAPPQRVLFVLRLADRQPPVAAAADRADKVEAAKTAEPAVRPAPAPAAPAQK